MVSNDPSAALSQLTSLLATLQSAAGANGGLRTNPAGINVGQTVANISGLGLIPGLQSTSALGGLSAFGVNPNMFGGGVVGSDTGGILGSQLSALVQPGVQQLNAAAQGLAGNRFIPGTNPGIVLSGAPNMMNSLAGLASNIPGLSSISPWLTWATQGVSNLLTGLI
jgi:hypothetical protein